jgi:hypothetical protein
VYSYTEAIARSRPDLDGLVEKFILKKTHCPLVFVDRAGIQGLPPAEFLALFHIVITTNQRFSYEWRRGSFEDELNDTGGFATADISDEARMARSQSASACPLLRVDWLRMIVDEGRKSWWLIFLSNQIATHIPFLYSLPLQIRWGKGLSTIRLCSHLGYPHNADGQ